MGVTMAVRAGSINTGMDALVGVWIGELDAGAGVEMYAVGAVVVVLVDRGAATLSEMGVPIVKKPVVPIPKMSPSDTYTTWARKKMLPSATFIFRKSYANLPGVLSRE